MLKSAAHTFFAIPELIVSLSNFIPRSELARCMLVCKDWSRQFRPRLWTVLNFDDHVSGLLKMEPSPAKAALIENLCHIRTVISTGEGLEYLVCDNDQHTLCTNLRRIYLYDFPFQGLDLMASRLGILLDRNLYLTHLEVPSIFLEREGVQAAVSKLLNLQSLIIRCKDCKDGLFFGPFREHVAVLQCCLALPELTELRFVDLEVNWDNHRGVRTIVKQLLETIISNAATTRLSRNCNAKKIKSLQLPSNPQGLWDPLPVLLLKSSLVDLETCEIPAFSPDVDGGEIEQLVREHCPNLKHVRCPVVFFGTYESQSVRSFIRGCSGLRSFTATHFDVGSISPRGMVLSELVSRHHTTLEVVELIGGGQTLSNDLQETLTRCKQLQRFWLLGQMKGETSTGIAFEDISRGDWVCTGLRELGLTLNRYRSAGDESDELGEEEKQDDSLVWLAATTTKRVYQQIGRLVKLEVLVIDIERRLFAKTKEEDYAWDLTLSKGWLGEMAGLKNLRRLELRAAFWPLMGQAEVEFMHEQWPKLKEIAFACDFTHIQIESACDFAQLHAMPHWQWLLSQRPHLRLVAAEW